MVDTHTYAKINLVSNAKLVHKSFTKFLNVYAYMYMQSLSEKIVECLKMEIWPMSQKKVPVIGALIKHNDCNSICLSYSAWQLN